MISINRLAELNLPELVFKAVPVQKEPKFSRLYIKVPFLWFNIWRRVDLDKVHYTLHVNLYVEFASILAKLGDKDPTIYSNAFEDISQIICNKIQQRQKELGDAPTIRLLTYKLVYNDTFTATKKVI